MLLFGQPRARVQRTLVQFLRRRFLLAATFPLYGKTSDLTPAHSRLERVLKRRVLLSSINSCVWTTLDSIPMFFSPETVNDWRVSICSIFSLRKSFSSCTFDMRDAPRRPS